MSRWVQQFKNHVFHELLFQLTEMLKGPFADADEDPLSIDELTEIARARKAIEYVRGIVENLDPEILGSNFLENLTPYAKQCIAELTAFRNTQRIGHLHNFNNNIDQIIALAAQSPFQAFGHVKTSLTRAANLYADTMATVADSRVSILSSFEKQVDEQSGRVKTQMESAELTLKNLHDRIGSVEDAVQAQLSNFNTTFQASEIARSQAYDAWQAKHQDTADTDYARFTTQISQALITLLQFRDDAEKVLGTVIDTAQAGAYAKYANEEKKNADGFRRLAIASMIAAALILFAPEFFHWLKAAASYNIDWQRALYRLPFSAILLVPAIYLAKESSSHRSNETLNRRRQHILTTISPYLALLDKDRADAIKSDVAKSLFSDSQAPAEEKSLDTNTLALKIADMFLTIAKKK